MKSQFGQKFNHDPYAAGYDENARNEQDPIRAGYQALQEWIGQKAIGASHFVDLGCGTGNTTLALPAFDTVQCVDISQNMLDIAGGKLAGLEGVDFVVADLLEYFSEDRERNCDAVVSCYAIHHLTQTEKHNLFRGVAQHLTPGDRVIFGDLMFERRSAERELGNRFPHLVPAFEDEFFWYIDEEGPVLEELGFELEVKRFSDLSWGIYGRLKG